MGYIKEPKGVDFIIKSEPLTEDERKAISAFIQKDKARKAAKAPRKKRLSSIRKKHLV